MFALDATHAYKGTFDFKSAPAKNLRAVMSTNAAFVGDDAIQGLALVDASQDAQKERQRHDDGKSRRRQHQRVAHPGHQRHGHRAAIL